MCEGTTTVTSGPQRYNSNPMMSRANESDQDCCDSRSLDGMQGVTVSAIGWRVSTDVALWTMASTTIKAGRRPQ
jgi:hypothetical protein